MFNGIPQQSTEHGARLISIELGGLTTRNSHQNEWLIHPFNHQRSLQKTDGQEAVLSIQSQFKSEQQETGRKIEIDCKFWNGDFII